MVEQVIDFICEYEGMSLDDVHENTHLVNDLGLTSLELFDLINAMENKFHLGDVKNSDIVHLETVNDIAMFIREKGLQHE